jgi:hypothetical protein
MRLSPYAVGIVTSSMRLTSKATEAPTSTVLAKEPA